MFVSLHISKNFFPKRGPDLQCFDSMAAVFLDVSLSYDRQKIRGVHKANKADRITCARTGWKVRYVTGRIENKRGRACRDLLCQSVIKIPAA
ncbi:hypothetical protein ACTXT7_008560 [Hymenolepis weldensis]